MIQPQSFHVILGAYSETLNVWAIQGKSGKYLAIPDYRFPGRKPIRFFASQVGAGRVLKTILELRPVLEKQNLEVVEVGLLAALRKVKADKTPPLADSFVINDADDVFELVTYLRKESKA